MDRLNLDQLMDIMTREVKWYAGVSDDSKAFYFNDKEQQQCVVVGIKNEPGPERSFVIVQARIVDDVIVVDEDTVWDKNLWKSLEAAGIPREQIVLAYLGESIPVSHET